MDKVLLTLSFLIIGLLGFSQSTVLKDLDINGKRYQILSDWVKGNDHLQKEIFRIVRLEEDSVISEVELDKYRKTDFSEFKSDFQFVDNNVFVFLKTEINKDDKIAMYGIDRIYINKKGNLFVAKENYFTPKKPDLKSHPAQFDGGEKKLKYWIQDNFQPSEFEVFANNKGQLKITVACVIDENGSFVIDKILGPDDPQLKALVAKKILKIPQWIPAVKNSIPTKVAFNIPIYFDFN